MKSAWRSIVVLVVAAACAGQLQANADSIEFTRSTGLMAMAPLSSTLLQFPQFNTALGQLNSVTVRLDGQQQAHVTAENGSPDISDWLYVGLSAGSGCFIGATGPGAGLYVDLAGVLDAFFAGVNDDPINPITYQPEYDGAGGDFHDFGLMLASGSDGTTLTTSLSPYMGLGLVDMYVTGDGGWGYGGITAANLQVANYQGSGSITVTYNFAAVPEPSTFALLGPFGALIFFCRRYRLVIQA